MYPELVLSAGSLLLLLGQPTIDLITMGPGDYTFSRWGHSAICVSEPGGARCYNYGTADFSTPGPLTWDFIRGRALFWVSVVPPEPMFEAYRREDRTVWRQRLPLTSTQAFELAARLEASTAQEVRFYRYHHFTDNCTTRIRDHLDLVTGGALRRAEVLAQPTTFRREARRGFAGALGLEIATDLLLGRATDHPIASWEAMFLPAVLMHAVHGELGVAPELVYERRGPALPAPSSPLHRALAVLLAAALVAALLRLLVRPHDRRARLIGVGLGGLGLLLWSFAGLTRVPELRVNELYLVLLPFDLALVVLGRRGRERYLVLRKLQLLSVLLLGLVGPLIQPLWPAVGAVALVLLAARPPAEPR